MIHCRRDVYIPKRKAEQVGKECEIEEHKFTKVEVFMFRPSGQRKFVKIRSGEWCCVSITCSISTVVENALPHFFSLNLWAHYLREMCEHIIDHCPFVRELWDHFSKHAVDNQCLRLPKIRPVLHEIGLYPSKSQGKCQHTKYNSPDWCFGSQRIWKGQLVHDRTFITQKKRMH